MDNELVFGNDFNHHSTAALTQQDRTVLGNVESALANGLQLKQWWEQTEATHSIVGSLHGGFYGAYAVMGITDRLKILDHSSFKDFAYGCAQTLHPSRWVPSAETGRFTDPLFLTSKMEVAYA